MWLVQPWLPVDKQRNKDLACALVIALTLVVGLGYFFDPRWETNDDVGMSMVAHGYGLAASGSPNLIFSNVIWGHFVRAIPQINGVWGYSVATFGVLIIFATVVLYALRQSRLGWLVSVTVVVLLLARPVLFPQFTINAGLMTIGAVICWHLYGAQGSRRTLILGCLLAFCGYLIRSQEFLLVLLVASPLLPWKKLAHDRFAMVTALALVAVIGSAIYVDRLSHRGEDWKQFNSLNSARGFFTDFGAGHLIKQHPEILSRHNYSANDIDLVASWFFVDPKIANPDALNAMLNDLGPIPAHSGSLTNGWAGIKILAHPVLLPCFFVALILTALRPSRWLLLSWGLFFLAFFTIGILGRPAVLRIYVPVISLLLIAPLLDHGWRFTVRDISRQSLMLPTLLVATIFNTANAFSESKATQVRTQQVRLDMRDFPHEPTVVWGAVFPFEAVYPVLRQPEGPMKYQLYGLGVFTLAPFSTANSEENIGRGMVRRLLSTQGVPVLAGQEHIAALNNYCSEHYSGLLRELAKEEHGQLNVRWLACQIPSKKLKN